MFVRKPIARRRLIGIALLCLIGAASPDEFAVAQSHPSAAPVLLDGMDAANPALQLTDPTPGVRIVAQAMVPGGGRRVSGAERIVLEAPPGYSVEITYSLPQTQIIDELLLSSWLSCSRPGVRLGVRAELPRTIDPQTGRPFELLLVGEAVSHGQSWEQMKLDELPRLLAEQARVARAQHGQLIDERGAVVRQLVFLVPGGQGQTELLVDEAAVYGVLASRLEAPDGKTMGNGSDLAQTRAAAQTPLPSKPQIPRVLQWNGEPFALVRQLGFDAASLPRLPSAEELAEARREGIYLVCPPPEAMEIKARGLGDEYEGVLAWDFGALSASEQIDEALARQREIEKYDLVVERPTLLRPLTRVREASRITDLVMLGSVQAGTTRSLAGYAASLSGQQRVARPGARFWVNLDTQSSTSQFRQWMAMGGDSVSGLSVEYSELVETTTASLGCRPNGFYFRSGGSLAGSDAAARRRAMAVELTNLRLGLAEPWLASGKSTSTATTSRPDVTAMVLKTERSHLLLPMQWSELWDSAQLQHSTEGVPLSILVSGVPESADAYLLAWNGPQRLRTQRVTGGVRISVAELPRDAMLLLTQDGRAVAQVDRYLKRHKARAVELRRELMRYQIEEALSSLSDLPKTIVTMSGVEQSLLAMRSELIQQDRWMAEKNYQAVLLQVTRMERLLERAFAIVVRQAFEKVTPGELPLSPRWSTISMLYRVKEAAARADGPGYRIPAGDFESLEKLMGNHWRHLQHPMEGISTAVRLSAEAPYAGSYSLELECRPTHSDERNAPPTPTAPVWITSPGIKAPGRNLLEIRGWARVPRPLVGASGELLIFDSLGGEESALRLRETPSWQAFRMLRAVDRDSEVSLTIALGGLGTAELDEVQYRIVPMAKPSSPSQSLPSTRSATRGLFSAPR